MLCILLYLQYVNTPNDKKYYSIGNKVQFQTQPVCVSGYFAVVIAACVLNLQRALALLVVTLLAVFFLLWDWLMGRYGQRLWDALQPARDTLNTHWLWVKWWENCIFSPSHSLSFPYNMNIFLHAWSFW